MTVFGVTIDDRIKRGMVSASLQVEAKLGRLLTQAEMDGLIVEFIRQVAERETTATVH